MALEDRDQPGGDPQREKEPGRAIDAGEGGPERREQGQAGKAAGQPASCRGGPNVGQYRQSQAQARKISRFVRGISQTKWRLIQ